MKVIFANSTEFEIYQVVGESRFINGQSRDSLTFVMPATLSLDEVDAMFNEAACESMKLVDETGEYVYKGYTIRCELKKEQVVISTNVDTPSEITEDVVEDRIFVTMARRTYDESQMKIMASDIANAQAENLALQEEVTNTQLALCEVYELMV